MKSRRFARRSAPRLAARWASPPAAVPGIALKAEGMGLGMILELPMIVINVQRGGPSTGLPTKTEQSDLLQGMFGRNGESPLPILAPCSPGDCFDVAIEAWRIATECMVPVIVLSDGYIANGSEPWRIPEMSELPKIKIKHPAGDRPGRAVHAVRSRRVFGASLGDPRHAGFDASRRRSGKRRWDGQRQLRSGQPPTHDRHASREGQARLPSEFREQEVFGEASGDVLVVSWGGTYGACHTAVHRCQQCGSQSQPRTPPLPESVASQSRRTRCDRFEQVLVPELNTGQLRMLLRAEYLVDCIGINKVQGKPFTVTELVEAIESHAPAQTAVRRKSKAG